MIRHILTVCAAVAAGAAATSLAQAQSYPVPPGAVYSPYPPSGPPNYRRGAPDFDALDEDDQGPSLRRVDHEIV